jgi:hypothetical protein
MTTSAKKTGLRWRDLLLLVPYLALMAPSLYARHDPVLWGFPFFYWYQFAWIVIAPVLTGVVFILRKKSRP